MINDPLIGRLRDSVPLFAGFSTAEVREFLKYCDKAEFDAGTTVIFEGEPGYVMYVALSGQLEVTRQIADGTEQRLARLYPGDVFGELSLLDAQPRSASVRTLTHTLLLCFDRRQLVKIEAVMPKLYRNLALTLAERLRANDALVSVLLAS